ncbi:MAG: hypothetical protein JF593_09610 [Novosphingobium sp.]|nr:hypothetical protein [Novosphingobium sp.]
MFFGPKLNTVFASRWKALLWSAGILATAYCSLPAADEARQKADDDKTAAEAKPQNPWAVDKR